MPGVIALFTLVGIGGEDDLDAPDLIDPTIEADKLKVCGRRPSDAHHLRFAQSRALGRKVSDEFTVPLCRAHHREVHRCGTRAS